MYYKNGKYLETLTISEKEWNQRLNNIFRRNIHKNHISGDKISIEYDLSGCVLERESDTGNITVAQEEYKRLYRTAGVCN